MESKMKKVESRSWLGRLGWWRVLWLLFREGLGEGRLDKGSRGWIVYIGILLLYRGNIDVKSSSNGWNNKLIILNNINRNGN